MSIATPVEDSGTCHPVFAGFEADRVMWLLAVETSGRSATIALAHDGVIFAERDLAEGGRRHAQTLVAEIDALCREHGLTARSLDAYAVSIGPGSFTGLRVGVVFAKTVAYATGRPLIAVDTLETIAHASPDDVPAVWVLSDAQRGDVYSGHYVRQSNGVWRRDGLIEIVPAESWLAARTAGEALSGPGIDALDEWNPSERGLRVLPAPLRKPRASNVARIALRELEAGNVADPWTLEPFYLRKPAAVEVADAKDDKVRGRE